jgi:hypothetical protein
LSCHGVYVCKYSFNIYCSKQLRFAVACQLPRGMAHWITSQDSIHRRSIWGNILGYYVIDWNDGATRIPWTKTSTSTCVHCYFRPVSHYLHLLLVLISIVGSLHHVGGMNRTTENEDSKFTSIKLFTSICIVMSLCPA